MAEEYPNGVDDPALDDAALEALAAAHATPPPPALRARLLREAVRVKVARSNRRPVLVWRAIGSVAAGLAIAFGLLLARATRLVEVRSAEVAALAQVRDELQARLDDQARTLVRLQQSVAAQATVLRVMSAPETVTAVLAATESGAGSGRVLVDATTGEAAVIVQGLPPAPPGKAYELWAIRAEMPPQPAGLFAVEAEAATIARVERVERLAEVNAFAVSIEPASGSQSPTGPIVLAGRVAG